MNEEIKGLIAAADKAIKEERFDDLKEFYTEDAVLVVKPELEVKGKEAIKEAFIKIAAYFNNSVVPTQGKMLMVEAGDTVLVLSQTLLDADNKKIQNIVWTVGQLMCIERLKESGYVL